MRRTTGVARVSTAASRARAAQGRDVVPGAGSAPWAEAERAAVWEHRWERVGEERARANHWGPMPVRAQPARPAWVDDDGSTGFAERPPPTHEAAAFARQTLEDTEFLVENERRRRDALTSELQRLRAEVESLDRQLHDTGEARRLAGRLWHDASVDSQLDTAGFAVLSSEVLWRSLSDGLEAVGWGTRPEGPASAMDPYHFFLQKDLRGIRVGSRRGSTTPHPRGGILGARLHPNGFRPVSISHRPDGACDIRTEQPWLNAHWILRSVNELVALLRSDVVNIGGAKLHGHSEPPDLREIDRSWELVRRNAPSQATIRVVSAELWCNLRAVACQTRPRWALSWSTVTDARPSFLVFSSDLRTPGFLCLGLGEREKVEVEAVYFGALAGRKPPAGAA